MHTDNPPEGELRFIPVREGRYRLIILDRHHAVHEEAAASLEELREWLLEQDGALGVPLSTDDIEHVQDLVDAHGACHVRTSMDADLVFIKGGAPRG